MKVRVAHIFGLLSLLFILYSFSIYLAPSRSETTKLQEKKIMAEGKLIWQKYNCQACHQIYGLGGYLGPDLTNIFSSVGKTEQYIKAIISSGTAQMPSFNLTDKEQKELINFLKSIDSSGIADPREFNVHFNGMISPK